MKYWLVGILIGLVAFIELTLYALQVNAVPPFVINHPKHSEFVAINPHFLQRYQLEATTTNRHNYFHYQKRDKTLRFVVMGASTAAGYPYGLTASLSGMLEQRLRNTYNGYSIEVVNVAMTAINSNIVRDMSRHIVKLQPDAVLLYMGHNEYYGKYSVNSANWWLQFNWIQRIHFSLLQLQTYQLLANVIANQPATANPANTMQKLLQVSDNSTIAHQSKRQRQGHLQFESNIKAIANRFSKYNIPLFVSTVSSNYKDQQPLAKDDLSAARQQRLKRYVAAPFQPVNLQRLEQFVLSVNTATTDYQFAQWLIEHQQYSSAKNYLSTAVDKDLIKLRADSQINTIIATNPNGSYAVVDFHRNLQLLSPYGLVGNNVMVDYVHPNVYGYFLLADSFYQSIVRHPRFSSFDMQIIATEKAWRHQPLNHAEQYLGYLQTLVAKQQPQTPMRLPLPQNTQQKIATDFFNKRISWQQMMVAILENIPQNDTDYEKTLMLLANASPFDLQLQQQALQYLLKNNAEQNHLYLLRRINWLTQ